MSLLIQIYIFVCRILAQIEIMYNNYIGKYLKFNHRPASSYIYIKNGEEIYISDDKVDDIGVSYDIVIKKSYSTENECFYGRVSHNTDIFNKRMYIMDETFMGIILKDLDVCKDYDIDLKKPINFYIRDNILLDSAFVKWYMNKVYGLMINNYKIELIDMEMNEHTLNKDSFIELSKNNYCLSNVIDESYSEISISGGEGSEEGYNSDEESRGSES